MAIIKSASHSASAFGILGNIVSFLVFLAPLPTFYKIYKRKSTEGFQSMPYSVALFSALLTFYYAFLKTNAILLITINSIGIVIESIYIVLFMIYATKKAKIYTTKLLVFFNVGAYGFLMLFTMLFSHGHQRCEIVGWICATFSVCVFAAPLGIMRLVIKTKSVKYMPFWLSFFLTLSAIMWFFYGFLTKDYFIATPNILGFLFGIAQMLLYFIYKNKNKEAGLHESSRVVDFITTLEMQENFKTELDQKEDGILATEDANNKPIQPSETNV